MTSTPYPRMLDMYSLVQDVRFSLRLMRRRPGVTLLVLTTLVIGMGLNTAIFTVVNAVLLRPLPIAEPDRVVAVRSRNTQTGSPLATSYPDFLDWRTESRSFTAIEATYFFSMTFSSGHAERLKAAAISAAGFKVWGLTIRSGRDFNEADDQPGAGRVVILTHRFWQREFGGAPHVLGETLVLDGQPHTIIGILEPTPLKILANPDVYVANGPMVNLHVMERDTLWFFVFGRLKRGVTLTQAQAEMQTLVARLESKYPDTNKNTGVTVVSMAENISSDGRKPLLLLMLASGLIFILAAVNVMTVCMGTTIERTPELSVRLAIGAPRSYLLRQLFIQAAIFAAVGGVLGLAVARVALSYFVRRFPDVVLRFQETSMDLKVVAVTIAMVFGAVLLATLLPAIYTRRLKISSELKGERSSFSPSKYRLLGRGAVIVFEIALASGLSLVSALLIKSFYEVEKIDLGFNPRHIVSFHINPPLPRYRQADKQSALYSAALQKLTALPGMQLASGTSGLPLTSQGLLNNMEPDAQSTAPGQQILVEDESVLPGFFAVMQVPILKGREFTGADREGAPPVVIIDDALAMKLWPGQNALGKRVRMSLLRGLPFRWLEIVGVARELKHFGGPEGKVRWMQVYVPQYQDATSDLSFVVNTTLQPAEVKIAAEKTLSDLDKDMPVDDFQTMDHYLDNFLRGRELGLLLLGGFAGVGIVLGVIGIYGVVFQSVTQRRREIAIRMAVGATPSRTIALVTRLGLITALAGIAIGSVIVMGMTRVLSSVLFGVSALDPTVYVLSALVLIALAITASAIPAMKLLRLNIQDVLRQ